METAVKTMNYQISQSETAMRQTARLTTVAVLVASAAALQIVESPLPRFLPWLKPGLANALTLYALLRISLSAGLTVAILRTGIAAIFLGSFLSPVHLISFAGAVSAAFVMAIIVRVAQRTGLATISVVGAIVSNLAQLAVVQYMFAGSLSLWWHLALTIWVGIPSGLIVAKVTHELLRRTL